MSLHRSIPLEKEKKQNGSGGGDPFDIPTTMKDFVPPVVMTYTDLHQLKGLTEPADYGSGIEFALGLVETFPDSALQIGLWLNGTSGCRDVLEGRLDERIYELFHFLGGLPTTTTTFLRMGYEFDNPSFGFSDSPSTYRAAFRMLVAACERQLSKTQCHQRVAFVWHSWAATRTVPLLTDFYPGDDAVDWVGVSIFQQLYPWANDIQTGNHFAGGNKQQLKEVLEFAKSRDKPIMIAESTPFGGMHIASTMNAVAKDYLRNSATLDEEGDILWDLWYQPTIDLIDTYDIAMWSYINCDWDSQPMWHGIGFGDTRLSSSKLLMANWRKQVLQKNHTRFVHRLHCSYVDQTFNESHLPSASAYDLGMASHPLQLSISMVVLTMMAFIAVLITMVRYIHVRNRQRPSRSSLEEHHSTRRPGADYGSVLL